MRSLFSYGQCDAGRQMELSETCKRDAKELAVLVTAQTRCDAQWLSDGAFFLHRMSRHLKHPGVAVKSGDVMVKPCRFSATTLTSFRRDSLPQTQASNRFSSRRRRRTAR